LLSKEKGEGGRRGWNEQEQRDRMQKNLTSYRSSYDNIYSVHGKQRKDGQVYTARYTEAVE